MTVARNAHVRSDGRLRRRSARKELVLLTAPLVFALGTAFGYGRGPGAWSDR